MPNLRIPILPNSEFWQYVEKVALKKLAHVSK